MTSGELMAVLTRGPRTSTELAARFGVTRQAIHLHLKALEAGGTVQRVGRARATRWEACFARAYTWPIDGDASEDRWWREAKTSLTDELRGATDAVMSSLSYGVTEMLNNAIDHSGGTVATLRARTVGDRIEVVVADDGVGAFQHVRMHFGLETDEDALVHIAKGQQTTAPDRHSGQGLFFTSKLFDEFELESGSLIWKVDNVRDDAAIAPASGRRGTTVVLRTSKASTRRPKDVFDRFTDSDTYELDRGLVRVSLSDHGTDFMSRSEAKRLAIGLELYGDVELDFSGVNEVGQGFVDELFRVWINAHPDTRFHVRNASPEVDFMIRRGLPR